MQERPGVGGAVRRGSEDEQVRPQKRRNALQVGEQWIDLSSFLVVPFQTPLQDHYSAIFSLM